MPDREDDLPVFIGWENSCRGFGIISNHIMPEGYIIMTRRVNSGHAICRIYKQSRAHS
jgi:hypothetical protein